MRDLNGMKMPKTLQPDQFLLDGIIFGGLGHRMLKTQNQLTYNTSPSRQTDGSMENINDYDSFILPKVELGFKFIDYETYQELRRLLLAKRTFDVTYYDKDFNDFVKHEMYAEPDDLTNFFNLGEMIIGSEDFVVRFIATLNNRQICKIKFLGAKVEQTDEGEYYITDLTVDTKWGTSIKIPSKPTINGEEIKINTNGYWIATTNTSFYEGIKYKPNDSLNGITTCTFMWMNNEE